MSGLSKCRVVCVGGREGAWWLPAGAYVPLNALFLVIMVQGHFAFAVAPCSFCDTTIKS